MGLINQLFKSSETARKADDHQIDCRACETTPINANGGDAGNRSFTYRPTGSEGVKPTPEGHDRDPRSLK